MNNTSVFTNSKIANEMGKLFGSDIKKVNVDMKFRKRVGDFVIKVDRMHQEAEKSEQIFK